MPHATLSLQSEGCYNDYFLPKSSLTVPQMTTLGTKVVFETTIRYQ